LGAGDDRVRAQRGEGAITGDRSIVSTGTPVVDGLHAGGSSFCRMFWRAAGERVSNSAYARSWALVAGRLQQVLTNTSPDCTVGGGCTKK